MRSSYDYHSIARAIARGARLTAQGKANQMGALRVAFVWRVLGSRSDGGASGEGRPDWHVEGLRGGLAFVLLVGR